MVTFFFPLNHIKLFLLVVIIFPLHITKGSNKMANESDMNKTSHFVLVHGASHGGWCWYRIKDILENMGYKVSCPDLTSSGTDRTDADTVFTFKHYNQPLDHLLESLPVGEKVRLVCIACLYLFFPLRLIFMYISFFFKQLNVFS